MASLTELRNEAAEALRSAKALAENGADQESYDRAWNAYVKAKASYDRMVEVEAQEKSLTTPDATPSEKVRNIADAMNQIPSVSAEKANANPNGHIEIAPGVIVPYASEKSEGWIRKYPVAAQHPSILARLAPDLRQVKDKQEEAFAYYFRNGRAAMAQKRPELLPFLNALQEDTDSEGGYLVPTDQRFDIIRNPGARGSNVRARSTVFTTTRDGGTFPTATSVTWAGIAEEASNSDSDPAFNQVPFTIRKSGANNKLSMELLADSAVNIPALLGTLYSEAKGRYEDQQSIEGDGTTEPLGLRTTGVPQGAISDISDVLSATPTAVEVIAAYFELPSQWRSNASWFMTSSLMSKFVTIGSTAAGIHFIEMMNGAPGLTLLGRPVFFYDGTGWDDAATISGSEELGAIGDFSQYYFVDRMGMTVARDDSVYFATDQVAFKARQRYDSLYAIADAFRILKA